MFKKFWHNRAYRKDLKKSLEAKVLDQAFKIKSVNVLLDALQPINAAFFDALAKSLNVSKKEVHFLVFNADEQLRQDYSHHFDLQEVSFFGSFNENLQSYCSKKVDLQINYFDTEDLYMNWVACKTSHKLSIGFAVVDQRINDIIFDFPAKNTELFKNELIKYLKILKKI